MKKLLLFVFAIFALNSYAADASLFDLNEDALDTEFAELSTLESAVVADPTMTVAAAQEQNLITEALETAPALPAEGGFAFDWGGFLWGFLCCPVGFFIVAIGSSKSSDAKTSFWIGVLANIVLSSISSLGAL